MFPSVVAVGVIRISPLRSQELCATMCATQKGSFDVSTVPPSTTRR